MAQRNFWTIKDGKVAKGLVDFKWESGMSITQKRKSCVNLHNTLAEKFKIGVDKILDISSASTTALGVSLSAFNLILDGKSVECWYQGSKVYEKAGHMKHLYDVDSMTAKKSMKNTNLGKLIGFRLVDTDYPMEPRTVFYDYIYLKGLIQFDNRDAILDYEAFTDIQAVTDIDACQARTVCIYKLLHQQNKLSLVENFDAFKEWHKEHVEVII